MNNPSPTITAPAAEATTSSEAGTIEQRQAALFEELGGEPVQPAGDEAEDATGTPAGTERSAPAVSPADSTDEARRAERRQRLDAMKLQTRQDVDRKERQSAYDKQQRDLTAAQERADLAEKRASTALDRSVLKDPIKVLRLLEAEGIPADQVANAIRESMTNPEIAATRAAREAISPEVAQARAENAALKARLDAFEAREAASNARYAEQRDTEEFITYAGTASQRAPLAAKLLAHDRNEFLQLATIAAEGVPPGAGRDALLDKLEDLLDGDVRGVAQKYAAIYGPLPTPSPAPQTRPGAVQPTTVSNSLAQGRTTLVEEEDFARLPLEERARRIIRSM